MATDAAADGATDGATDGAARLATDGATDDAAEPNAPAVAASTKPQGRGVAQQGSPSGTTATS